MRKLICKNIIKILTIYKKSLEHNELIFEKYIDQTIYFQIEYLIKLIKEKEESL